MRNEDDTMRATAGAQRSLGFFAEQQVMRTCCSRRTWQTGRSPQAENLRDDLGTTTQQVFAIEIDERENCGGPVRITASIVDADVFEKILNHLGLDQKSGRQIRSQLNTFLRLLAKPSLTSMPSGTTLGRNREIRGALFTLESIRRRVAHRTCETSRMDRDRIRRPR